MSIALPKSGIVVLCVVLCQWLWTIPTAAMPFQAEGVGGGNARLYVVHGGANAGAPFGGELGVVNLTTGSYNTIGTPVPGASLTGLAYSANQLYVSTSNHSLAILNLAGGLISETPFSGGGFDAIAGDRVNDLAASRSGNLYASTFIGGVYTLCSVEPSIAELTVLGPLPDNGGGFHSLAFLNDRLYSHQTNSPGVFDEVSLTTGVSVNAIPGGVPGGALGLAGNSDDGALFASECCLGDDNARGERLFVVDPDSGAANLLIDFDDGRRIQDLEFVPVPNFDRGDMFVVHGGANVGAPFGGELGIIDTETGAYLSLGTPVPGAGLTGLAFSRNRFYASTSNLTLAEISLSGSLISENAFFGAGFSATDRVSDLASDSAGRIYGAARISSVDTLVRINPDTAELTVLGPLPLASGGFKALAFVTGFANDRLFSHETNAPGQFDQIDVVTGASVNTIAGGVGGGALGMGSTQGVLVASECCLLDVAGELGERIFILDPTSGNADQLFDFNDGRRIHDIEFIPQQMYVVHGGANAGAPFGGELGSVNLSTGGYRTLSTPVPGAGLTGLAYANNRFFISTSNHTLAVTDLSGGLLTETPFFGSGFDPLMGDRVNDLAIDRNGSLYAATIFTSAGTSYSLCRLNPATAELNLIGSLPENGGGFQALSFAGSRLFGQQTNFTGPVFDQIDVNTGASLNMIAGGIPGGALGLGYSPFYQLLFGSECCDGDDGALGERIWFVDPADGFSFPLVDYDDGRRIQDIEFVPAAPVLRSILRSVTPTRGTYVSGGIPELDVSDNVDYQMRRSTTDVQSRTEFVIRGISPSLFPVSMEVTLEGAVFARSQVDQIIELFNYDTSAWEQIDVRPASRFSDSTTTVAVPGQVSRFVDADTGAMEARIRYRSLSPRQQFSSNTDLFLWNIGL